MTNLHKKETVSRPTLGDLENISITAYVLVGGNEYRPAETEDCANPNQIIVIGAYAHYRINRKHDIQMASTYLVTEDKVIGSRCGWVSKDASRELSCVRLIPLLRHEQPISDWLTREILGKLL